MTAAFTNPSLVATPQSVWDGSQKVAGAGIIDSGTGAWDDLVTKGDFSALTVGADVLAVGLDALSLAVNPLGELIKAGVGWIMEHVAFIREPLELLTGDHRAIQAVSQTWTNIGTRLGETAGQYEQALSTISGWTGEAADGYRRAAGEYIEGLRALAGHADNTAQGVTIAGIVVATERAIVFDLISSFISRVIAEALIAAASSVVTLGGSVAAFLTSVTADAVLLATRLAKRLAKLLTVVKRFVSKFDELGSAGKQVTRVLEGKSQSIHNWADRVERPQIRNKRDLRATGGPVLQYTRYADEMARGPVAPITDNRALFTAKEGIKATKDSSGEPADG